MTHPAPCHLVIEIRPRSTTVRCTTCRAWLWVRAPVGSLAFAAARQAFQLLHAAPTWLAPGTFTLGRDAAGRPVLLDSLGCPHTLADLGAAVRALEAQVAAWTRASAPPPWVTGQLHEAIARRQVLIRLLAALTPDEAAP